MPADPYSTPAMKQFTRFKAQHPDCVLFFRMGDFYEMFGDDALRMADLLGLKLMHRGTPIPTTGVPHHQLHSYLRRAVDRGVRVAVCDQIQDPKDAKGVVDRAVTRVVTPGTLIDEALLEEGRSVAVAAAVVSASGEIAVAAIDLSAGTFELFEASERTLADELTRRGVRELLHADNDAKLPPPACAPAVDQLRLATTPRPAWQFGPKEAAEALHDLFGVGSLAGFGLAQDDPAIPPAGALVRYLTETQAAGEGEAPKVDGVAQRRTLAHLRPPRRDDPTGVCLLDAVSLRALEIERVIRPEPREDGLKGSLLGVFLAAPTGPRCVTRTAMGKRLLAEWLRKPLSCADAINERQAAVAALVEDRRAAEELTEALHRVHDVARSAARVALGRASPRDLVALAGSIAQIPAMLDATANAPALASRRSHLEALAEPLAPLADRIAAACVDEPPAHLRGGGLIRDGVDPELDEARALQRDAGEWLAAHQAQLNERHDLPGLKVGFNKVFGYYIELPAAQARRAPPEFTRKQTLKNAERFVTPELKTFEEKVTTAEERALERERALFVELLEQAAARVDTLGRFADAAAQLDALAGLAEKAHRRGWTRPTVTDEPVLSITNGRHPVLDELLGDRFVPNDASLGADAEPRLALITGPNMAGKSTYIRQTALLTVLASAGSYVPADDATIGACDRVFTRVGADDALHRGQSTFMVEMTETAAILNNATPRSLVILDEIGRGTSTLDGLSLAWAVAESLAGGLDHEPPNAHAPDQPDQPDRSAPRALFATHYHELTELEHKLPGRVRNLHVQVREWPGPDGQPEIVFVHRIAPGRADRSYGVHVARLAGVPRTVTDRAQQILETLSVQESGRVDPGPLPPPNPATRAPTNAQLGLFTEYIPHPAVDALREVKVEMLSPIQAFDVLRELHRLVHDPADQAPTHGAP